MKLAAAPARLSIKKNEKPESLFMSYGLLNRLTVIIGGVDNVNFLANDPRLQETVLLEVFTKRENGKVVEVPESLDEVEVSLEDMQEVLDWVGAHITDFFLSLTQKTMNRARKTNEKMKELTSLPITENGTSDSQPKKQLASPSDASPQNFGT